MRTHHKPILHARDHLPGGADPIPGIVSSGSVPGGYYDAVILAIPGLWGYWRLGEMAEAHGGLFADRSGNDRDMAIAHGTPNTYPLTRNADGAIPPPSDDSAVEFNIPPGETIGQSYGEFLQTSVVGPASTPMTACGWLKCKAHAATMHDGVAFGTAGQSAGGNIGFAACVTWPARTLRFMRYGSTSHIELEMPVGVSLLADTWYFVAYTDDGTTHRFYVNGVEVDTAAVTITGGPDDYMRVGWGIREGGSYQWRPFYGMVDEVAVWTVALTEAQILYIFETGRTGFNSDDVPISDGSGGVTWGKIGTGSIDDGAVTEAKIADGSVTTTKIADGTIVDVDVDAAADIAVTKLAHPGGTTTFLRADGTWAAPSGGSSADTAGWMPLTTVVGGVPDLVWDSTDSLIPTYGPF